MLSEQGNRTRWMRDRMVCRHLHGAAGKWTRKDEDPKYAPDRTCDVEHLRLDLTVDLPGEGGRGGLHPVVARHLRADRDDHARRVRSRHPLGEGRFGA